MLQVFCKRLRPEAVIPTQAYDFDAGWDLYAPEGFVLVSRHTVMLGLALDIPPGYCAVFKGRSGLARADGIDVLGGVVDAGYRGEVGVTLTRTDDETPMKSFPAGAKIAQMLILPVPKAEMIDVGDEKLSVSQRGSAGFGSSDRATAPDTAIASLLAAKAAMESLGRPLRPSGAELILAERLRQIEQEGWTPAHDDGHSRGQLLDAGLSYVHAVINVGHPAMRQPPRTWPWDAAWWKPSGDRVRDLVKAGALFSAEIDRILRLRRAEGTEDATALVTEPELEEALQVPSVVPPNIVAEPEIEQAHGADEEV